jgi:hypothetical protein
MNLSPDCLPCRIRYPVKSAWSASVCVVRIARSHHILIYLLFLFVVTNSISALWDVALCSSVGTSFSEELTASILRVFYLRWRQSIFSTSSFLSTKMQKILNNKSLHCQIKFLTKRFIFWDMVMWSLVEVNCHFRGKRSLHLLRWRVIAEKDVFNNLCSSLARTCGSGRLLVLRYRLLNNLHVQKIIARIV